MASQKPLRIGTTVPIQQFESTDYVPTENGGVPPGGSDNYVLKKQSSADFDYAWEAESGGGGGGGGLPYAVYTALLTQSGTDAPVATVMENTLGGTVVWDRSGDGIYTGTLAGAFTANKTVVLTGSASEGLGNSVYMQGSPNNVDFVDLFTGVIGGSLIDDELFNSFIEIRVYP